MTSPPLFVKRKSELYAKSAKKVRAQILCIVLLVALSIINVPTFPYTPFTAHGKRHIPSPAIPEQVRRISSIRSYPLYEIKRNDAEPSIIINTVQAFVYQVAEIDEGK